MDQYRLSSEEHQRIFKEGVKAPAMATTSPADAPLAVFLGGQPGCGKSTLARSSAAWFGNGNFVHVDVDRVRPLHPAYLPMLTNPVTERAAPTAVQKDCSAWADQLRECASKESRNMLVESTMRSPHQVREAVTQLREAGYKIEARILVVHEKASEVALLQRFEHEKQALGFGREIPPAYHALAAAGLVDTVRAIEGEKLADKIILFNRQGHVIYQNELVAGQWQGATIGASTMQRYREASYGLEEKQKIAAQWDDVATMMERRNAPAGELDPVKASRDQARLAAQQSLSSVHTPTLPGEAPASEVSLVRHGQFSGKIIEHRDGGDMVVQKIGRDPSKIAIHLSAGLTRLPEVGEVVHINYRDGQGLVSERGHHQGIGR